MATPEHKLTDKGAEKSAQERAEIKEMASREWRVASEKSAGAGEERSAGSEYKIRIPMYEGPLDLLLDLIKQQKMSIHDIRISEITAQYLDYLHKLEELDVDV